MVNIELADDDEPAASADPFADEVAEASEDPFADTPTAAGLAAVVDPDDVTAFLDGGWVARLDIVSPPNGTAFREALRVSHDARPQQLFVVPVEETEPEGTAYTLLQASTAHERETLHASPTLYGAIDALRKETRVLAARHAPDRPSSVSIDTATTYRLDFE